jgi:hypothetical protein
VRYPVLVVDDGGKIASNPAVDFLQVVGDVTGGHAFHIQADHRLVEAGQPAGVLRYCDRLERPGPIPRHVHLSPRGGSRSSDATAAAHLVSAPSG